LESAKTHLWEIEERQEVKQDEEEAHMNDFKKTSGAS
jgi:hypothetical protein